MSEATEELDADPAVDTFRIRTEKFINDIMRDQGLLPLEMQDWSREAVMARMRRIIDTDLVPEGGRYGQSESN